MAELVDVKKVYGPYLRPDGRKHVILIHEDRSRRTVSYPKYLLEQHLGRKLNEPETCDHINGDFTDDRIENLRVLSRPEQAAQAQPPAKMFTFICPICEEEATKFARDVRSNLKKGKRGPFCSRHCAGVSNHI